MNRQQIDALLTDARNPDGSQRFYPPGEHPAADAWREQLAKLEAFADQYPITPTHVQEMIDHAEQQIAMVEEGEARAKQLYLRARGVLA